MIGFEEDFCSITAGLESEKLEVVITKAPNQKVLKINGLKKPATEFIGQLKAVFFSPDDLSHMSFAPKLRRRYVDVLLSQLSHEYLDHLMRYQEAKRKRNVLLKYVREGESKREELGFWDEQLAKHGLYVRDARRELLSELEPLVQEHYRAISSSDDSINIHYESEILDIETEESYLTKIKSGYDRDIATGKTNIGPHRDDLRFELGGKDMVDFASRGEWRSLVLALKFAEIELIKQKTGDLPVLLLDDVFSELDESRQKYLFKAIKEAQTFVSTTHKEFFSSVMDSVSLYSVDAGYIS